MLVERTGPGEFWISDHPVILHNDQLSEHRSNRGLKSHGIQIYLPISPSHALAFFCPSVADELERGLAKLDYMKSQADSRCFWMGSVRPSEKDAKSNRTKDIAKRTLEAIREKKLIHFNKQNTIFLNSMQVITAHRFIGSSVNDFSLAVNMLKKDPSLRSSDHISFG